MIDIYTEKKDSKDWIIKNDLFFNLNTSNEEMSDIEVALIKQVDDAKLTPDKHIETKYGLGTIRNLSSGCKTLLNIVKHPEKVVCVEECGPNVLKGYYRDTDATSKVLSDDGWFRTGDYGHIDEDGFVWVTGRASRTIVLSSGKKIAPEELEERILALPGIREAVVSGDGDTREIRAEIYAVIPEESARREIAALNNTLPVYKRLRTVVVRDKPFPRTDSGKIKLERSLEAVVEHVTPLTTGAVESGNSARTAIGRSIRPPGIVMILLTAAAIAVPVLGLVPHLLAHEGVDLPASVSRLFTFIDLAGELLLGLLALLLVLKIWDKRR